MEHDAPAIALDHGLDEAPDSSTFTKLADDNHNGRHKLPPSCYGALQLTSAPRGTFSTTVELHHTEKHSKRPWTLVYNIAISITLEPVLFLYAFGFMVSQPVYSYMMMDKLCVQHCNYSAEQCEAYGSGKNDTVDTHVKKVWAQFDNYSTIISTIPVIIYAIFMGPWSDVFGRKKPMALSFVGVSLGYIISLLLYLIPSLPVWMVILPNLMSSMTGGLTALLVSAFCYAADVSHGSNTRTIRFALYDVSLSCGSAVGGLLGGILMGKGIRYYVCYIIGLGSSLTALMLIIIQVHDIPILRSISLCRAFGSLFTTKHIASSYEALTKPRAGRSRRCIWLVLVIFVLVFTTETGEIQLTQKFFTNAPLRWTLSFYLLYNSVFEFGCMAAAGIFIPAVKKVFHWRDTSFTITACVFRIIYTYGIAVMTTDWLAYVFTAFDLIDYGCITGPRIIISKLVADDEQGKILSLFAVAEAVSPLLGSIAGTAIFTATAETWPGFFGVAEAYTMLVALALLVLVDYYIRLDENQLPKTKVTDEDVGESPLVMAVLLDRPKALE